jgi:predicted membrane GTPase involved in stress response
MRTRFERLKHHTGEIEKYLQFDKLFIDKKNWQGVKLKKIIRGQLNKRQTKKTTKQDSKQRRIKIRKYHLKKKQTNPDKPYKPCLISKNHNL